MLEGLKHPKVSKVFNVLNLLSCFQRIDGAIRLCCHILLQPLNYPIQTLNNLYRVKDLTTKSLLFRFSGLIPLYTISKRDLFQLPLTLSKHIIHWDELILYTRRLCIILWFLSLPLKINLELSSINELSRVRHSKWKSIIKSKLCFRICLFVARTSNKQAHTRHFISIKVFGYCQENFFGNALEKKDQGKEWLK